MPRIKSEENSRTTGKVHECRNSAGGQAFKQTPEYQLISLLLCATLNENAIKLGELETLLRQVDPKFAAKAAWYARHRFGMRTATHILAALMAARGISSRLSKPAQFFNSMVYRADDITAILTEFAKLQPDQKLRTIPNAMKRGLGAAMSRMNAYALAKYRSGTGEFSMVDAANLLHPRHTPHLRDLIKGTLQPAETWETKMSAAGQASAEEGSSATELKADAFRSLLKERKLPYLALLRNLRNLAELDESLLVEACEQLVVPESVQRSLVFPFRFMTAHREIEMASIPALAKAKILEALETAADISMRNVPTFDGETLVALDQSGSMRGARVGKLGGESCAQIGALFAVVLLRANPHAEFITFATDAQYQTVDASRGVLRTARDLPFRSGGTNFESIFITAARARRTYDRIIILSDMQAWDGRPTQKALDTYRRETGSFTRLYSFDLRGEGTLQTAQDDTYAIAGYSDRVFTLLGRLERDQLALIREVQEAPIDV